MSLNPRIKASLISMATDALLIGVKGFFATLSGSAALFADALHSLSDLFVSLAVLVGGIWRVRADRKAAHAGEEPSEAAEGQGKHPNSGYLVESILSLVISLVILYIPYEIVLGVTRKASHELRYVWVAVAGTIACILIAYFLSRFKIIVGRQVDSPALVADGYHSRTDMYTSIAVVFSLLGHMIGIRLDGLVAVVIAVLIGVMGVELLLNSVIALATRSELGDYSLARWIKRGAERLVEVASKRLTGTRLGLADLRLSERLAWRRLYTPRRLAAVIALLMAGWGLSGLATVGPGQTGVRVTFGQIVEREIGPGLTYAWPWPIGALRRMNTKLVGRVELGFRSMPSLKGGVYPTLWEADHIQDGYKKNMDESLTLSGDENLVDLSLVMHYRYTLHSDAFWRIKSIPDVLRGLLESSMREVVATEAVDALLVEDRQAVLDRIKEHVSKKVAELHLDLEIIDVLCHDVHPPVDAVVAFRDVFSAREEKARMLNEAEAYRNATLPKARADNLRSVADADAEALEKKERATGEAERFRMAAAAYHKNAAVTSFRLFMEMAEQSLADKQKVIANPAANLGGYRLWLFAPGSTNALAPVPAPAAPAAAAPTPVTVTNAPSANTTTLSKPAAAPSRKE